MEWWITYKPGTYVEAAGPYETQRDAQFAMTGEQLYLGAMILLAGSASEARNEYKAMIRRGGRLEEEDA